jgi:hypothetical protein
MPLRSFRSSSGAEWRVWSVLPGRAGEQERRHGYDRRSPDPIFRPPTPDRRVSPDRRQSPGESAFGEGWLVFECGSERRRLMPIPPGWEVRSEADLERLCGRATPAAKTPQPADGIAPGT